MNFDIAHITEADALALNLIEGFQVLCLAGRTALLVQHCDTAAEALRVIEVTERGLPLAYATVQ